ncbi:MAG TPA: DUF1905 domain-containing protein [Acidimicrobiales bacterium]
MAALTVTFEAELWRWKGDGAWHFVTVPFDVADQIEERASRRTQRGFGSVRVEVTIGASSWSTSVFPDKNVESYVLPVKKQVRAAENIGEGEVVTVHLRVP